MPDKAIEHHTLHFEMRRECVNGVIRQHHGCMATEDFPLEWCELPAKASTTRKILGAMPI